MATKKRKPTPTTDLQRTVTRLRREGERLASGLEKDVRRLAKRVRAEFVADVRGLRLDLGGRAATAVRTGRDLVSTVERRVAELGEQLLKQLQAATSRQVAALERRVAELERRTAEIEERLGDRRISRD
jgi:uncharacterized protein involved in exopolysaccharide biosynthesis